MNRIYLDHNASSPIDPRVSDLMVSLIKTDVSYNPSSIHEDGRKARSMLEKARAQVANSLGISLDKDDLHVIFTSSGTEANNLAMHNFRDFKFFVSAIEHVSILELREEDKITIPVDSNGLINIDILDKSLRNYNGKKIISIMLANNETGVINDIKAIADIVHNQEGILHCDASQAFGKISVNFKDLNCDLLTISGHKCGAPLGAAALIAKNNFNLKPLIKGGKQEQGLRAGTENLLAISGFGLAAELAFERVNKFKEIESLRNYLEDSILKIAPDSMVLGKDVLRLPNTSNLSMPGVKSEEQLIRFDLSGVSISAGSACSSGRIASSHVLKAMNLDEKIANEFVRVSLGITTRREEIDQFIDLWKGMYKK